MHRSDFFSIIKPRIVELWPLAGKYNDGQWTEWGHALAQFEIGTVENALVLLYQQGAKYSIVRLNEIMAVCYKSTGSDTRQKENNVTDNYQVLKNKHPDLAGMTHDEIDNRLAWTVWQRYQRSFGDGEPQTAIAWKKWQDVVRHQKGDARLDGTESHDQVINIYREMTAWQPREFALTK